MGTNKEEYKHEHSHSNHKHSDEDYKKLINTKIIRRFKWCDW